MFPSWQLFGYFEAFALSFYHIFLPQSITMIFLPQSHLAQTCCAETMLGDALVEAKKPLSSEEALTPDQEL